MKLSAEEMLAIAVKVEANASDFYRRAARTFAEESAAFERLARMEDIHKRTFMDMQERLDLRDRSQKSPDPFFELQTQLELLADTHGGEGRPAEIEHLRNATTLNEVIKRSIALEKKTIDYYASLVDVSANDGARQALKRIIGEEEEHVRALESLMRRKDEKEIPNNG